jgi:hypothetical protein
VISYVLPIRTAAPQPHLTGYLEWLAGRADVVVVDGSGSAVFAEHARWWGDRVRHVPVDAVRVTPMGKVGGVITGLHLARSDKVVIADDDVRYDEAGLGEIARLLDGADVVRPQNVFTEWPWHAWWDTGRSLLARATGGDWPGTLGVRRRRLLDAGGYAGDVMFENLELVRTVRAAGGREVVARGLYVDRIPPQAAHFWRQRVRQAYDELARPAHLLVELAIVPAVVVGGVPAAVAIAMAAVGVAQLGRRRDGGGRVFPRRTTLAAPCWVAERAVTSWLAVASRLVLGGIRYGDAIVPRAASSPRALQVSWARRARDVDFTATGDDRTLC